MTSVERVWKCPCCKAAYRRIKDDYFPATCGACRTRMVRGFGYARVVNCGHRRAKAKVKAFNDRMRSRVRTQTQRAYAPSREVKALWRNVRRAKTRPAVVRRAEVWFAAVLGETRAAEGDERWTQSVRIREIGPDDWQYRGRTRVVAERHKHRTTYHTIPTMGRITLPGLHGDFRRVPFKGVYGIRLAIDDPIDELRNTIVHEVLHVLDSEADIRINDNHDALWRKRLAQMDRWFPAAGVK